MNALSPWALSASSVLASDQLTVLEEIRTGKYCFQLCSSLDSLWIKVGWPKGGCIAFRAAFSPAGALEILQLERNENDVELQLLSDSGKITVNLSVSDDEKPVLRYITTLTPEKDLFIPFWPRDILIPGKNNNPEYTAGKIHASQEGNRSGFIYLSMTRPKAGSILYLQNLTALADYCQQTKTSCGNVVGGNWPEMGFALPPAREQPLKAGKAVTIGDAIVTFDEEVPKNESAMIRQYLDLLATVYLILPRPETSYQNWPETLDKGLKDLIESPGCWSQVKGNKYFNAYISDYTTPPEIMVQLAVLLPLLDYAEWSGKDLEIMETIRAGLSSFYNEDLGTIMRWLPAAEDQLEEEEEQKKPMVMDSWYLHHPLLNLSRLALKGDKIAEKLFLDSLEYAIKVAHHFNYQWPVFYKMDTLEIIKAETSPGKGGEKDVPGIYAHVMLQAWELTKKKRFLNEAQRAAKTLKGLGFDVFYQANNTAFSSGALLRLWKITGNKLYLELSYMCLAGIFKNTQLWDCNYGYGKNFPSFFALFPLNDAPYTAVYEEQEVFCALHDYLKHAEGEEILPSVSLLVAEYIRYLVERAVYYYPPMLPKEMLEEDTKVGEVDPRLWIALEDMHDGWEKSGTVGQEVYGAGNAFGILPRHYFKVPGNDFMIYIDYPVSGFRKRGQSLRFRIAGHPLIKCRMMVIKGNSPLPSFTITVIGKAQEKNSSTTLKESKKVKDGNLEYSLNGTQEVVIRWK